MTRFLINISFLVLLLANLGLSGYGDFSNCDQSPLRISLSKRAFPGYNSIPVYTFYLSGEEARCHTYIYLPVEAYCLTRALLLEKSSYPVGLLFKVGKHASNPRFLDNSLFVLMDLPINRLLLISFTKIPAGQDKGDYSIMAKVLRNARRNLDNLERFPTFRLRDYRFNLSNKDYNLFLDYLSGKSSDFPDEINTIILEIK